MSDSKVVMYVWMKHPRPFQAPAPGVHTLSVWVREDGVMIDRITLTASPRFAAPGGAKGTGPAESPRR